MAEKMEHLFNDIVLAAAETNLLENIVNVHRRMGANERTNERTNGRMLVAAALVLEFSLCSSLLA